MFLPWQVNNLAFPMVAPRWARPPGSHRRAHGLQPGNHQVVLYIFESVCFVCSFTLSFLNSCVILLQCPSIPSSSLVFGFCSYIDQVYRSKYIVWSIYCKVYRSRLLYNKILTTSLFFCASACLSKLVPFRLWTLCYVCIELEFIIIMFIYLFRGEKRQVDAIWQPYHYLAFL